MNWKKTRFTSSAHEMGLQNGRDKVGFSVSCGTTVRRSSPVLSQLHIKGQFRKGPWQVKGIKRQGSQRQLQLRTPRAGEAMRGYINVAHHGRRSKLQVVKGHDMSRL